MSYFFIYIAMSCLVTALLLSETKYIKVQCVFLLLFVSSLVTHFMINPFELYRQLSTKHFPTILFLLLLMLFIALVMKLIYITKINDEKKYSEKRDSHD